MNYYNHSGFHLIYKSEDAEVPKTNIFDHGRIIRLDRSFLTDSIVWRFRFASIRQFMPIICIANTEYIDDSCDTLKINEWAIIAASDTVSCLHGNRLHVRKNRFGQVDVIDL